MNIIAVIKSRTTGQMYVREKRKKKLEAEKFKG
jgi:hypothetical protein